MDKEKNQSEQRDESYESDDLFLSDPKGNTLCVFPGKIQKD